jgi:hypothetical protein
MNVGESILAMLLGFIFSFIAVLSSGTTDINPVSTCAKASQLIFGGVGRGTTSSITDAQMLNLLGGVISAGSAGQSSDMTGDLKTGYLLRAKPRVQFIAQLAGATVAIFLNVGLYILFTTASPCIICVNSYSLTLFSLLLTSTIGIPPMTVSALTALLPFLLGLQSPPPLPRQSFVSLFSLS